MSRIRSLAWIVLICMIFSMALSVAALADKDGSKTGSAQDVIGATAGAPTSQDYDKAKTAEPFAAKLADVVGESKVGVNLVWTLVAGFLVMFMQAGFALVETGFTRAKNASHTMFMNFAVYAMGIIGFFICGFAFMYGNAGPVANLGGTPALSGGHEFYLHILGKPMGIIGTRGFFLTGDYYDVMVAALFLFQMVFMDTAVTIPTGALAERWTLKSFWLYSLFMSMILYPLFGNWAWGGGWLSKLGENFGLGAGYMDFAGSGVVHSVGGLCALAGAIVLGPRIGKFNRDGSANAIPGHHIPMALLGTFILAFGWFGFNPGSSLGAAGSNNFRIAMVATNTMLASASGLAAALIYMVIKCGKPDPTMGANGMLAGLVAITAPCAFVNPIDAFIIGAISGILVCLSVAFIDKIHVDDPVGAISVHGANGLFGVLSVGLFADGSYNGVTGLLHGGGFGQLAAQLIGIVTLLVWAFGVSYIYWKVMDKIIPMRVSKDVELAGLDMDETGILAYPEFEMK